MILQSGDMWQIFNRTDLFCITTNSTLKQNGSLVMGRGIALQAKNKLPGIDLYFGKQIKNQSLYGLATIDNFNPQKVAAFQVKYHWQDKADLDIIKYSVQRLREYCLAFNPSRVDLNFPGIGNGRLDEGEVLPIIVSLPDCVYVWRA